MHVDHFVTIWLSSTLSTCVLVEQHHWIYKLESKTGVHFSQYCGPQFGKPMSLSHTILCGLWLRDICLPNFQPRYCEKCTPDFDTSHVKSVFIQYIKKTMDRQLSQTSDFWSTCIRNLSTTFFTLHNAIHFHSFVTHRMHSNMHHLSYSSYMFHTTPQSIRLN